MMPLIFSLLLAIPLPKFAHASAHEDCDYAKLSDGVQPAKALLRKIAKRQKTQSFHPSEIFIGYASAYDDKQALKSAIDWAKSQELAIYPALVTALKNGSPHALPLTIAAMREKSANFALRSYHYSFRLSPPERLKLLALAGRQEAHRRLLYELMHGGSADDPADYEFPTIPLATWDDQLVVAALSGRPTQAFIDRLLNDHQIPYIEHLISAGLRLNPEALQKLVGFAPMKDSVLKAIETALPPNPSEWISWERFVDHCIKNPSATATAALERLSADTSFHLHSTLPSKLTAWATRHGSVAAWKGLRAHVLYGYTEITHNLERSQWEIVDLLTEGWGVEELSDLRRFASEAYRDGRFVANGRNYEEAMNHLDHRAQEARRTPEAKP